MLKALRRNVQQLETLVGKVLEENTNLQTEIGIKLERREFDLWPLVEALIHDLHPVAGTATTQLINKVPDDLVVYADASLLRRVFQNLIANAIQAHTARRGYHWGTGTLTTMVRLSAGSATTGRESPKSVSKRSSTREKPIRTNAGGSGLGLAIVKTFTEAHGGRVTVETKEKVGSTFRFSLPTKLNKDGPTT